MRDLTSKAEVLETYAELFDMFDDSKEICKELCKVYDKIRDLPTIEPKRGKWETEVRTIRGHKIAFFACSVCGKNADDEYRYCPNCGTRMERSEE